MGQKVVDYGEKTPRSHVSHRVPGRRLREVGRGPREDRPGGPHEDVHDLPLQDVGERSSGSRTSPDQVGRSHKRGASKDVASLQDEQDAERDPHRGPSDRVEPDGGGVESSGSGSLAWRGRPVTK